MFEYIDEEGVAHEVTQAQVDEAAELEGITSDEYLAKTESITPSAAEETQNDEDPIDELITRLGIDGQIDPGNIIDSQQTDVPVESDDMASNSGDGSLESQEFDISSLYQAQPLGTDATGGIGVNIQQDPFITPSEKEEIIEEKQDLDNRTAQQDYEAYGDGLYGDWDNVGSREAGPGSNAPREVQPDADGNEGDRTFLGYDIGDNFASRILTGGVDDFWQNADNPRRNNALEYGITESSNTLLNSTDGNVVTSNVEDIASSYLDIDVDKNLKEIKDKLKVETNADVINSLELQRQAYFDEKGYLPLYNVNGDETSGVRGYLPAEVQNEADDLANSTSSEENDSGETALQLQRKQLWAELVHLGGKASDLEGLPSNESELGSVYGSLGSAFTVSGGKSLRDYGGLMDNRSFGGVHDFEQISFIKNSNTLPKNLEALPGNSLVARKFNERLKKYKVLNRAIEIQASLDGLKEESIFGEFLDDIDIAFGGDGLIATENNDRVVQVYKDIMEYDMGYKVDVESIVNREGSSNKRRLIEGGLNIAADIAPLAAEIYLTRKIPLGSVAKYDKYVKNGVKMASPAGRKAYTLGDAMNKSKVGLTNFLLKGNKSRAYAAGVNLTVGGVDEIAKLYLADQVGGALWNQPGFVHNTKTGEASFAFPFALGVGNVAGAKIINKLKTKHVPILTPVLARFPKSKAASAFAQANVSAAVGTSTLVFAEMFDGFIKDLTGQEKIEAEEKDMFHHLAENYLGMFFLGGKATLTKMGKGLHKDISQSNILPKRLKGTTKAERKLGLKYGAEPEAIEASKKEKLNEISEKYKNEDLSNQNTLDKYNKETSEVRKSANDLQYFHEYNAAKKTAKAKDGYYKNLSEKFIIGNKIQQGKELTTKEKELIAELEAHEFDYLIASTGLNPNSKQGDGMRRLKGYYENINNFIGGEGLRLQGESKTSFFEKYDKHNDNMAEIQRLEKEAKSKPAVKKINLEKIEKLKEKNEKIESELNEINQGFEKVFEKMLEKEIEIAKAIAESTGLKGEFKAVSEQAFQEMLSKKAGLKFSKGQKSGIGGYYDRKSDSIWLNKEHLKDYRDLGAPLHEVTHAILKKSLKFKNGKLTKEGRQAIDKFLEGLNEKDRAIVEKRVNDNYRFETFKNEAEYIKAVNSGMFGSVKGGMPNQLKDVLPLENGNIKVEKKPEFFAEEYVTAWSDAVKNKQIKYTPELGQKLSDAFYPLLKKVGLSSKFEINDINGENLFMAMQTIQRGSIKGKLRGDIVQLGKAAREGDYTGNVMSKNITKEQAEQAIADVNKMKELERFNLEMLDKYRPEQMNELRNEISEAKKDLVDARSLNEKDIAKQDIKNAERKLDEFISNELNSDAVYKRASDRFKTAIGETTGRLATALTKRLFDPIAQDYKGSVTREGYKESLIGELEQMVIKEYKPELQGLEAFITNRGWLRAQSLAKRLGVLQEVVEGGKQKEYGSLQDFGTQRSIKLLDLVEGMDRTRGEKLRAIEDKVKADVGKAKDVLSVIKAFMPKAKFELVDYKDLKSEYLTDIVDTFVTGVRPGEFKGKEVVGNRAMAERIVKAMKKSADLNTPEMMVLQKVFDRFHDSFWASLPQGYTSTAKATMNRPKSLYKAYYNEMTKRATQETFGISAGKQGRRPYIKFPNIKPSDFKLPLGIKPEGSYVNLKEHGGLYKLMVGEYARAFENQAVRLEVSPAEAWAKHLADGRSPLMFSKNKNEMSVNDHMQQGRDIRNVYEIGKGMIESFGNKKKYREATRGVDPVVVDAIEQLMMNRNENLTVGGNGYQKQVLLNSFTPEVVRNLITPGGQWKGLKLNDPATKEKYVNQAFEFAKLLPPSMSSTWIENALGLKDGYKGTIKVTDYKVEREALKNRKFTPGQQKKFDKLAKDLKIDVENLGNAKQMMNSGYVGKVLESLGREVSLSKKKATLEGYKGELSNVNRANHDMLKLFNELMKQEYSNKNLDANFVMLNGALQTNIVAGKRAMSTFEYIYLREGKQQGLGLPAKSKKIKGVNTNITNTPEYKQKYKEYIDSWKECAEWSERFEYNKKNPKKGKTTEELTLSDLQWKNEHLGASATTNAESASYMYSNGKSISLENINNGHRTLWAPKWVCDKVLDAKLEVDGKQIDNKVSYEGPMRITKFAKEILQPGREILHFTGENAITHIMKANKVAEMVNEIADMSNASVQKVGAKMTQFGVFSKNNPKQTKANIKIFDKAMELGRDPNKKSRGGSFFDFDDTLATTKSGIRYEMPNPSGKPQPSRKVIFMAGAPGAGKSTVIKGLDLLNQGFKIVNQDIALERLMKESGMPTDMREMTSKDLSNFGKLSGQARRLAGEKKSKYTVQGEGMIIDGTGASLKVMEKSVKEFREAGYDAQMVFVETTMETAVTRNKARKERSLKTGIVKGTWEKVIANKQAYQNMFGERFAAVKTDNIQYNDAMPADLIKKLDSFTKGYIKGRINAEQFAANGAKLLEQGAKYDFSEFNKVVEGAPGPLLGKAIERVKKFGNKDMYIVTARPAESARPIHEFLKSQGLDIPLENITGLGNSTAEAKAMYMLKKFSEGYNDMYFVDDAIQNVKAVKDVLKQLDIKSDVQQALMFSKNNRDKVVNEIMEHAFGIESKKKFSKAEGKVRGKDIKRRRIFIPDGAADLELLIEPLYGKGKKGIENKKWFEDNFQRPWERGINDFNNARQAITTDYMSLRKKMKDVVKLLPESVEGTNFTHDMAIRAYIWNKAGHKIPDLAPTTKNKLVSFVESNPSLKAYAETVSKITRVEGGLKEPSAEWWGETLATEIQGLGEGIGRKKYIQEFIDIKNEIFSETNLNKMESQLGTRWRESIEDMFERMETGRSRSLNLGRTSNAMMNYLNGSVGAIMNFNTRSAALQLISSVNFVNHSFNNPLKAAAAFANQPQYWKDFMTIMNSDMLKQRRAGLEINVTEAELASAVRGSKNPAKAALSYILKAGFLPTKVADSFAISAGGSTFYRNSINKYVKEGLDVKEAERRAFLDFQAVAERTQQSSRADLISQQQTSLAGRFILPFANTPLQMNRIMMKEVLDISKGRYKGYYGENSMTHKLSKIGYFGFAQSLIFAGLQSGAFALMTNSDDEKLVANSKLNSLNTVADSFLRGMGIQGAALNAFRLAVQEFIKQDGRKYNADYSEVAEKLLNISPTVGSKFSKLDQAGNTYNYNKKVIKEEGLTLNGPLMETSTQVIEALTNAPLNRYYRKGQNIQNALDSDYENWQRILMGMGWSNWGLGVGEPVLKNKGKENEYTKYLTKEDLRREGVKEKVKKDKKEAKKANQQRCTKIKSDYSRCKMMVDKPKTRCHYHD